MIVDDHADLDSRTPRPADEQKVIDVNESVWESTLTVSENRVCITDGSKFPAFTNSKSALNSDCETSPDIPAVATVKRGDVSKS